MIFPCFCKGTVKTINQDLLQNIIFSKVNHTFKAPILKCHQLDSITKL